MNPQVWWYVSRASGLVAWLALTASVLWGVVLSTKAFPRHRRPAWLLDLHRWLGGLTVAFVAIHLIALVADSYVEFDLVDLVVPFASDWEPAAVAFGVLALWLLVAVEVTSVAMRRLPKPIWRGVHLVSYALFWLTSIHAALAGTDASARLYQVTAVAGIVTVAWATMYRIANRRSAVSGRTASQGAAVGSDRPGYDLGRRQRRRPPERSSEPVSDPDRPPVPAEPSSA